MREMRYAIARFASIVLLGLIPVTVIAQISLSAFGSYSASVKDSTSSTDFYEGFGTGLSLGLYSSSNEYFLSYRQSLQQANYSNISDPEFFDHSFRAGVRFERNWSQSVFPIFELAGDLLFLGSSGSGNGMGYGGSFGVGIGMRASSNLAIRLVPELGMLFFSYSSMRRRFFNQRVELALRF